MIIGNPDKFALYLDVVDEWKNNNEINGLSGLCMNGEIFITNFGLISLDNEFLNFIEKVQCSPINEELYKLGSVELFKNLIKDRYPNWWANSQEEWDRKINDWNDISEVLLYDFRLESFSVGNEYDLYLFGIRGVRK
ncbi:Imm42 family immunity protein [Ursidibacter sp. B-7004-1]